MKHNFLLYKKFKLSKFVSYAYEKINFASVAAPYQALDGDVGIEGGICKFAGAQIFYKESVFICFITISLHL